MSLMSFYNDEVARHKKSGEMATRHQRSFTSSKAAIRQADQRFEQACKRRPLLRTRKSGILGPEIDWSVRESDLPRSIFNAVMKMDFNFILKFRPGIERAEFNYRATLPDVRLAAHGCCSVANWDDYSVRYWTIAARRAGVEYRGDRGYYLSERTISQAFKLPGFFSPTGENPTPAEKRELHLYKKVHGSSKESRFRRKLRRIAKSCASTGPPVDFLAPSAKQVRALWGREKGLPFQKFKSGLKDQKFLSLTIGPRYPLSDIVIDALERIYSREEIVPVPALHSVKLPNKKGFVTRSNVSFDDSDNLPPVKRIRLCKVTFQETMFPKSDRIKRSTIPNVSWDEVKTRKGRLGTAHAVLSWF